jgi:antitoxin component of MazEF toxin-antitoxin module
MKDKPSRLFVGKVKKKAIGLETLLRISQHGDGAYLFIPKDVVDCYRLLPGDRVKVRLVESFRLIAGVQEEAEATREEKIEPVLVVPRSRRRRRKMNLDSDTEFQEPTEKENEPTPSEEENSIDKGEL